MAYIWFNSVLEALGKRINFESISNMYGKTVFDKKGGEAISQAIQSANPLRKTGGKVDTGVMGLMGQIKVIKTNNVDAQKVSLEKELGDISWAEGLTL